jgi:hypothetical protein
MCCIISKLKTQRNSILDRIGLFQNSPNAETKAGPLSLYTWFQKSVTTNEQMGNSGGICMKAEELTSL